MNKEEFFDNVYGKLDESKITVGNLDNIKLDILSFYPTSNRKDVNWLTVIQLVSEYINKKLNNNEYK